VLRVVGAAAAREQIFFVERERFADRHRAAFIVGSAGLPPGESARLIDGLPIGQDMRRACGFEIVGERNTLDPLDTAVGDADAPSPRAFIAPVAERYAGAPLGPVGVFAHVEAAAGGGAFAARLSGLRHGPGVRRVSEI